MQPPQRTGSITFSRTMMGLLQRGPYFRQYTAAMRQRPSCISTLRTVYETRTSYYYQGTSSLNLSFERVRNGLVRSSSAIALQALLSRQSRFGRYFFLVLIFASPGTTMVATARNTEDEPHRSSAEPILFPRTTPAQPSIRASRRQERRRCRGGATPNCGCSFSWHIHLSAVGRQ